MKIRFESFWNTPENLTEIYNMLTPNNDYKWDNLEINHLEYDYIVVQGSTGIRDIDYSNVIVIQCEPYYYRKSIYNDFFRNEHKDDSRFMVFFDIDRYHPVDHWILDASHKDILNSNFNNKIDSRFFGIFSSKHELPGHKDRLFFIDNYLDHINLYDSFLSKNYDYISNSRRMSELKRFNGVVESNFYPYRDYKYTIQSENCYERNYFTQVAIRPILCECLMFYAGCPNLEDFIHPDCFIRIDYDRPEEAIEIIYKSIVDNEWDKRISSIKRQKQLLLNENNALNIIKSLIDDGGFKWKTI